MILYGASGHAKVIYDCLSASGIIVKAVFDSNQELKSFVRIPVSHQYDHTIFPEDKIIIAIGNNKTRGKISATVQHSFGIVKHPSSIVSPDCFINEGSVILHQAVVQAGTVIGKHCIVNTSSSVDHDCVLGDFVHIAPGATICGGVEIGEGTLIGAGATVIPNIKIGKWCVVGAGAVVTQNIPDKAKVVGVPARKI